MIWYGAEKYEIVGRRQEMIRGNRQRPGERSKPGVAKGGGYLVIFAVAGTRSLSFLFCENSMFYLSFLSCFCSFFVSAFTRRRCERFSFFAWRIAPIVSRLKFSIQLQRNTDTRQITVAIRTGT